MILSVILSIRLVLRKFWRTRLRFYLFFYEFQAINLSFYSSSPCIIDENVERLKVALNRGTANSPNYDIFECQTVSIFKSEKNSLRGGVANPYYYFVHDRLSSLEK